ncbi:MAG: hypothetical protein ACT4QC_09705 [Planctomycetaceae bacterium]
MTDVALPECPHCERRLAGKARRSLVKVMFAAGALALAVVGGWLLGVRLP